MAKQRPGFIADPVMRARAVSPLAGHIETGQFGVAVGQSPSVRLGERFGLSIAEVTAWKGRESKCRAAIKATASAALKVAPGSGSVKTAAGAFNIAPMRWLVSGESPELVANLADAVGDDGTVTDLSHGRTVIRVDGEKSRWVLAKLFAVDLSDAAMPRGNGLATAHHDIFAQIQRVGADAFDVYVFRSFARSFWHLLCRSAEEAGYRID